MTEFTVRDRAQLLTTTIPNGVTNLIVTAHGSSPFTRAEQAEAKQYSDSRVIHLEGSCWIQKGIHEGGGETVDLGPINTRVDGVEGRVGTVETKVTAVEAHSNKFPTALTADKYVIVNPAGDGYALSEETVTDVQNLALLGAGVVTGDACLNQKCLGTDTVLTGNEITQVDFAKAPIVMGTPAAGVTQMVRLAVIAPYLSTRLEENEVREGGMITVVNLGAGSMQLTIPSGHFIQDGVTGTLINYTIGTRKTITLFPSIYDNGDRKYIVTSNVGNWLPT